jgi:hypothetical protein
MQDITDARLAAQRMIQVYGESAVVEARKRAEDAGATGQIEAEGMWKQIGKMIIDLAAQGEV